MAKTKHLLIKNGLSTDDSSSPPGTGTGDSNPKQAATATKAREQGVPKKDQASRAKQNAMETFSTLSSEISPMEIDSHESDLHASQEGLSKSFFGGASTRVDGAADTNQSNFQPFVLRKDGRLGSDKRRHLSNKIARLKQELYNCVLHGITLLDEASEEAKRQTFVTMKLVEKATKAYKLLFFGEEATLVPSETPLFQWQGHIIGPKKGIVYPRAEACLDQFERVIFAHRIMSLEDNWRRLVPARMSTSMAPRWWYNCLVRYLFKAIPRELTKATNFYLKTNPLQEKLTADFAIEKVVATHHHEALYRDAWPTESRSSSNAKDCFLSKKSYRTTGKPRNHSDKSSNAMKGTCKYYHHPGLHSHDTADCLLSMEDKKKIDKIYKKHSPNAKFCFTCKAANFKKGEHVCPGRTNKKRKITSNIMKVVPTKTNGSETYDSSDDDNTDSHMTFSALAAIEGKKPDNCKSIDITDFTVPPVNIMENNSLILPMITLESHHCTVKTYFLLDIGASFSCILPALADT